MIKKRNIVLCIIFSIITCGIYWIYWWLKVNGEMNRLTPDDTYQTGGLLVFIFTVITFGIYRLYWAYKMGNKMNQLKGSDNNQILYLILQFIGLSIVNMCLMQAEINSRA